MKKLSVYTFLLLSLFYCTSCATVFGGKVSECQRTKPAAGQPARQVRAGAMIANILLFPLGLIVDFGTGAIYKPCEKK